MRCPHGAFLLIVTAIFFLLPAFFLCAAWRRSRIDAVEAVAACWRTYSGNAALLLAACCTVLELLFFFSWFKNGGSPHGMMPSDGLWTVIRRLPLLAAFAASIMLGAFGKGKWRLRFLGWGLSLPLVVFLIFALEMD